MDDHRPYVVESPTRIRLGRDALYWGKQHGMSVNELGKFLLRCHQNGEGHGDFESVHAPEVEVHNMNLYADGGKVAKQPPAAPPTRESRYLSAVTDAALKERK